MTRFTTMSEDDTGWTEWVQPRTVPEGGYKLACCDCGLVHDMEFRVRKGRVQFRASRNRRSTAAVRREKAKRAATQPGNP